ncbi:MAG: FadR/GntR family transcriptional regulator [Bacillota bacterium]
MDTRWVRDVNQKPYMIVVERIQTMISKGVVKPGHCLLSERMLVEKLNVSRNSVREALKALECMGLVNIVPGQGAFVKKPDSDDLKILATIMMMQEKNLKEVLEVRRIIEMGAIELVCRERSMGDLEEMRETLSQMESATSLEKRCEADVEFHVAIVRSTHNALLLRMMVNLAEVLKDQMPVILKSIAVSSENVVRLLQEHRRIYAAIEAGREDVAREEIACHLRELENMVGARQFYDYE